MTPATAEEVKTLMQDQVADLWEAVNKLREGDSLILTKLSAIQTLLEERCTSRQQVITDMRADIKSLQDKYNLMDKLLLKNTLIVSVITAVLSSVATALAAKMIGKMLGG